MKFHKYTQTERTNILSPYIQDKLKSAKLNLILNLGFPQNLIDNMLPYIEDEAPAWQLRMISFFDADPEELRLTLEGAIKEESIGDFQEILFRTCRKQKRILNFGINGAKRELHQITI